MAFRNFFYPFWMLYGVPSPSAEWSLIIFTPSLFKNIKLWFGKLMQSWSEISQKMMTAEGLPNFYAFFANLFLGKIPFFASYSAVDKTS